MATRILADQRRPRAPRAYAPLIALALVLLVAALPAEAKKRRAVSPGTDRCTYGPLDRISVQYIDAIALDDTHAYYYNAFDPQIARVSKMGGLGETLARFEDDFVIDVAVDDTNVYVSALPPFGGGGTIPPGTIFAIPKSGGAPRAIANGIPFPAQLAVDATHVYWTSVGTVNLSNETVLSDGSVGRVAKSGGAPQTLASGLSVPIALVVDANFVFFTETGEAVGNTSQGVRRVPKAGGAVQPIQSQYAAAALAQTETDLIFYGGDFNAAVAGFFRVPKVGGTPQLLAQDSDVQSDGKIHDGHLYYITLQNGDDEVFVKVPVTGGPVTNLRTVVTSNYDFEIDECGIYYGDLETGITRVER